MNNEQNTSCDESKTNPIDFSESLNEKHLKNKAEIKKIFSNIKEDPNTSGIFFNFLDSIFDLGTKLLNSVDLDVILDKIEELMKKEK
ncbi:MAG: hypothetical protein KGD63_04620 [Candidatus Lokiarchaeota archaeon]|nr:hypothetical protein [Candidatus Lokiarchaeota archaeon]